MALLGFVAQTAPPLRWQPQRMSEPQGPKARYKTTNWTEYNAALKARAGR